MSYVNVWIHAVWATKCRYPFLIPSIKDVVIDHIKENAIEKQIHIDTINGIADHMHCLICLNPTISISDTLQLIKGESSKWINDKILTPKKFIWQSKFFAESVNPLDIEFVRKYIRNQEEHHKKRNTPDYYDKILKDMEKK